MKRKYEDERAREPDQRCKMNNIRNFYQGVKKTKKDFCKNIDEELVYGQVEEIGTHKERILQGIVS